MRFACLNVIVLRLLIYAEFASFVKCIILLRRIAAQRLTRPGKSLEALRAIRLNAPTYGGQRILAIDQLGDIYRQIGDYIGDPLYQRT